MSTTQATPSSDNYNLHARLIGGVPTAGEDLFISIIFGFVFFILAAAAGYRWQQKREVDKVIIRPFKTAVLLGVAISCAFLGLAFWIRAGLAGGGHSKGAYAAEQVFFVLASLIWVDLPALTLTRDEVLFEIMQAAGLPEKRPLVPPRHWLPRFVIVGRVLLILSAILYIYGFSLLPDPAIAIPPPSKSSALRLAASLIVFLVLLLNLMAFAAAVIITRRREVIFARLLVFILDIFVLIPAFYNFFIVAVTDDQSPLLSSKLFFYFAYIFFPVLIVAACIAFELNVVSICHESLCHYS